METTFLDRVFGLDVPKAQLLDAVRRGPEEPIVLVAPPGCGKTKLARALVYDLGREHVAITPWSPPMMVFYYTIWKIPRMSAESILVVDSEEPGFSIDEYRKIARAWQGSKATLLLLAREFPSFALAGLKNPPTVIEWGLPDFEARRIALQGHVRQITHAVPDLQPEDWDALARISFDFSHDNLSLLAEAICAGKIEATSGEWRRDFILGNLRSFIT